MFYLIFCLLIENRIRKIFGLKTGKSTSLNIITGHRTMSDKSCFTTDTVVPREVKNIFYKSPTSKNSGAFVKHRPLPHWIFYEHFNR